MIALLSLPVFIYAQGCMEASSDEGVNVVGYLQAQYQYEFKAEDDTTRVYFNRARMGLVGNIPYDFSYYIMYEFSPAKSGAPYLLDGFITYSRFAPYARLSVGRFKSPFSLELNTPCQGLHTINRSQVVNNLANPGRDVGLMLTGKMDKIADYSLAFTNGTGKVSRTDARDNSYIGRLVLHPFGLTGSDTNFGELSFGGSYNLVTALAFDSLGVDTLTTDLTRYAIEGQYEFANFLIQGEYIRAEGFRPAVISAAAGDDGGGGDDG